MSVRVCPTCGHPVRVEIDAADVTALLPKYQRRLYDIVCAAGSAGLDSASIYARMYADCEDGGPQSFSVVGATARHLNIKLARIGLAIEGRRSNGHHGYRLVRLEAAAE